MGEYYIGRPDELYHYGVKGMKWGVRHDPERIGRQRTSSDSHYQGQRKARLKKAAKIGAAIAVTAVAAYGAYKYGPKLASSIKRGSKAMSGYELRKMGISTFEPNRIEINRGTQASAARQAYYQRHGKSFGSSNITKARKIQGYSNKNYTDLGRSEYKLDRANKVYEKNLKKYKNWTTSKFATDPTTKKAYESGKNALSKQVFESRMDTNSARYDYQDALNRAYSKGNYKRTKSINYRNLTRRR